MKNFFISFMVSVFVSYFTIAMIAFNNPEYLWSSKTIIVQFILANGLGFTIGCANLLFRIQHWPYIAVLSVHYIVVVTSTFIIGKFGNWFYMNEPITMISLFLRVSIVYVAVWIVLNFTQKRSIKQMNELLQKNRGE
ncbi:DUF3021 domain-containing protein [Solibacillus daqui]|uniref:DUF3021 domain-containing protein n=1 Tax=Solibacillus daqui TaxID=2912187 RepID=UPI002365BE02|nr:DUF3021 domain-containing protein [Solibacillus daqui]